MLPSANGEETNNRKRSGKQGSMKWLTNEMLSAKQEKIARILAVKVDEENKFGPRIILKLALDGDTVFWGVPTKKKQNPNYPRLLDKFGRDENDWVEKEIGIKLEKDEFTGDYFSHVSSFPSKSKTR